MNKSEAAQASRDLQAHLRKRAEDSLEAKAACDSCGLPKGTHNDHDREVCAARIQKMGLL